ncbi:hypothetical protein PMZ80_010344 [Knufia obscura]|uniref:Transcription elongation factor Eaf N-terminal domain-containing protein n=2 Tax=Knufia TaxID=430999 RepID=A0AAN8F5L4_9EURO|nr:hypothetical protein PMZ80_010344 [Knufia obscura]KAK5951851.1 hypothetical protein OHC33_007143 [Knufia fluminis]
MVDIHQPGEHRIILGDSLKDGANSSSRMSIKYNWTPKEGLNNSSGTIKGTKDDLTLSYQHNESKYDYEGWLSEQPEDTPQLALFYDKEQSAYVLEKLTASLNVNIKSGTGLSSDYIKRHAQLPKSQSESEANGNRNDSNDLFDDGEDETPDPSNPFDYRNFLDEAKEAAEKQSSRTPLPGGRTPMSGLSSPLPAGGHLSSNTPSFGPIEIKSGSKNMPPETTDRRRRKAANATTTSTKPTSSRKAQTTTRPKPTTKTKQPQALLQEMILDSDPDSSDDASADMSDRPSPASAKKPTETKTHHRNISAQSPRIIVDNDASDDCDLEIDTGSPPPETRKRNYKIDPSAFRSGTGTPQLGRTAQRSGYDQRPVSRGSNVDVDVEMRDADEDDADKYKYLESDDEEPDHNGDVDELILDDGDGDGDTKPRSPTPPPVQAPKPKRRQSSALKSRRPKAPSPPPLQASNSMEDDDGGLAAELEAALEREQAEQEMRMREEEGGVGLGIGVGGGGGGQDEEEDISEEE